MKVHFIGLNSRYYPYTRVRCYNFAHSLEEQGISTRVYALSDDYLDLPEERFTDARDRLKLKVQMQLFKDILLNISKNDLLYFQKVHHHIAAPYLYARLKNIPYIVDYDDWDFDRSPFFNHSSLNRLFFRNSHSDQITPRLLSGAHKCIVSSHYLEKTIRQYNPRVYYLPTGVDLKMFKAGSYSSNKDKPVFFWNGDVWGDVILENLIFLFSAFSELLTHKQSWKLQLVVFGSKVPQLKRILENSYSKLPVELIENIPPSSMPSYYAGATFGLMPLLYDESNYHWIQAKSPTKLFEYMAMKLIPVCHDEGEPSHIIQHGTNGYLYRNRAEFIGILNDLLDNYNELNHIAENAYQTVRQKYSLPVLGKQLKTIIEDKPR